MSVSEKSLKKQIELSILRISSSLKNDKSNPELIKEFLINYVRSLINKAIKYVEVNKRKRITEKDIEFSLNRVGISVYKRINNYEKKDTEYKLIVSLYFIRNLLKYYFSDRQFSKNAYELIRSSSQYELLKYF
tara:strand:+ start:39 stop:437 length:399 start_codon:yes stop_codon:yes gene_type:complete